MTKEIKTSKQKKATASDVAKRAGVSKWTVSRAFTPGASISAEAQKNVLAAAAGLGYRPNLLARSLTKKQTHIIGVAIDEFKNPHSMKILDVVTKALQARGYLALMLNITEGENHQAIIQMADQLQVDGILFVGNALSSELYEIIHDMHYIPLIQVLRNSDSQHHIEVVNIDGYQAGREIAQLLLEQGHKRFGYMKGPDTESSYLLRMEGYRDELQAHGYELDQLLIAGNYDRLRAYKLIKEYLQTTAQTTRIEALFCENDILAIGALEALYECEQQHTIGIVGFDGIDESGSPVWALTTYRQDTEKLMAEAISLLIDNKATEDGDWRKGELIIRRSHQRA